MAHTASLRRPRPLSPKFNAVRLAVIGCMAGRPIIGHEIDQSVEQWPWNKQRTQGSDI